MLPLPSTTCALPLAGRTARSAIQSRRGRNIAGIARKNVNVGRPGALAPSISNPAAANRSNIGS